MASIVLLVFFFIAWTPEVSHLIKIYLSYSNTIYIATYRWRLDHENFKAISGLNGSGRISMFVHRSGTIRDDQYIFIKYIHYGFKFVCNLPIRTILCNAGRANRKRLSGADSLPSTWIFGWNSPDHKRRKQHICQFYKIKYSWNARHNAHTPSPACVYEDSALFPGQGAELQPLGT